MSVRMFFCKPNDHHFKPVRPSRSSKPPFIMLSRCRRCPAILFQTVQAHTTTGGNIVPETRSYLVLCGQQTEVPSHVYLRSASTDRTAPV